MPMIEMKTREYYEQFYKVEQGPENSLKLNAPAPQVTAAFQLELLLDIRDLLLNYAAASGATNVGIALPSGGMHIPGAGRK